MAVVQNIIMAPRVTVLPAAIVATPGGNAGWSANVIGLKPLSYQWQLNGANLAGATTTSLSLIPRLTINDPSNDPSDRRMISRNSLVATMKRNPCNEKHQVL